MAVRNVRYCPSVWPYAMSGTDIACAYSAPNYCDQMGNLGTPPPLLNCESEHQKSDSLRTSCPSCSLSL
eukprot:3933105-Rhodomonas_salina.1